MTFPYESSEDHESDEANEDDGTVFYLVPINGPAKMSFDDVYNNKFRKRTRSYGVALQIRLGCYTSPPYVVRMGDHRDDKLYVRVQPGGKQCHFYFNPESGQLLLEDVSRSATVKLYPVNHHGVTNKRAPVLSSNKRQCAVVLSPDPRTDYRRVYELHIGDCQFRIFPPFRDTLTPEAKGEYSCGNENIQMRWPPKNAEVPYSVLYRLGSGGEGEVYAAATTATGTLVAFKICQMKYPNKPPAERRRISKSQLSRVREACKTSPSYIVPWYHCHFREGGDIQIFMPIFSCSLQDIINSRRLMDTDTDTAKHMAAHMLHNISTALCCLSGLKEPVVHRDIKPANILYRDGAFYLADFGLSKTVNRTHSNVGTRFFMSPEIQKEEDHEPPMDVFSLGLTLAACLSRKTLDEICDESRGATPVQWVDEARGIITTREAFLGQSIQKMLRDVPAQRPTATRVLADVADYLEAEGCSPASHAVCSKLSLCDLAVPQLTAPQHRPVQYDTAPPAQPTPQYNFDSTTASIVYTGDNALASLTARATEQLPQQQHGSMVAIGTAN